MHLVSILLHLESAYYSLIVLIVNESLEGGYRLYASKQTIRFLHYPDDANVSVCISSGAMYNTPSTKSSFSLWEILRKKLTDRGEKTSSVKPKNVRNALSEKK